jgi:predicted ester cyclase
MMQGDHSMMMNDMNPAMHQLHMDARAVETFYEMLSNPNDPDLAMKAAEVIDVNWDSEPTPRGGDGLDGFVKSIQAFGQMIPNLNWSPQEVLKDGNRYIVRSIATGTPVQPFFGVAPTGKSFQIMSIDIHTVENGKIMSSYHIEEWATAIQQLKAQ